LERAIRLREEAGRSSSDAQQRMDDARRETRQTEDIYSRANDVYEQTVAAVRQAGSHYLNKEMEWAQEARRLYDQAASGLQRASGSRKQAEEAARAALQKAKEALAHTENLERQVNAVRTEGEANLRAEEDARRITEQKRRDALLAIEKVKAALDHIENTPHEKFLPGEIANLRSGQKALTSLFEKGDFDRAKGEAENLLTASRRAEEKIIQAVHEYEHRKAQAEGQANVLKQTLANMERGLITEWSDAPAAIKMAEAALKEAQEFIWDERFDQAAQLAGDADRHLKEALRTAAENKTSNEKRETISDAVMEVLEELGFEVSWEPGTRTAPLRISGMTPDQQGKGDFDIVIPLDGQVDFEINTPSGDTTCVAAVEALQKRLAERGIVRWQTTDWGHAHGSQPIVEKTKVREKEKIKTKLG
jgi:hypothetical protein